MSKRMADVKSSGTNDSMEDVKDGRKKKNGGLDGSPSCTMRMELPYDAEGHPLVFSQDGGVPLASEGRIDARLGSPDLLTRRNMGMPLKKAVSDDWCASRKPDMISNGKRVEVMGLTVNKMAIGDVTKCTSKVGLRRKNT